MFESFLFQFGAVFFQVPTLCYFHLSILSLVASSIVPCFTDSIASVDSFSKSVSMGKQRNLF